MKKVSKILLGSILCILMITLGFGFNSQAAIDCTITFEEGEGGSEYFVIVDENGVTSDEQYSGSKVESGNKITLYANPKEGYRFVYWIYQLNGTKKKLSEKTSVSVTIKQSYAFTAVYAKDGYYVVSFTDNSGDVVFDYQIVEAGKDAKSIDRPSKKKKYLKYLPNLKKKEVGHLILME